MTLPKPITLFDILDPGNKNKSCDGVNECCNYYNNPFYRVISTGFDSAGRDNKLT